MTPGYIQIWVDGEVLVLAERERGSQNCFSLMFGDRPVRFIPNDDKWFDEHHYAFAVMHGPDGWGLVDEGGAGDREMVYDDIADAIDLFVPGSWPVYTVTVARTDTFHVLECER